MNICREIVFIDTALTDWETLLTSISKDVEVVLLDPHQNGVAQIAAYLAQQTEQSSDKLMTSVQDGQQAAVLPVSNSYIFVSIQRFCAHALILLSFRAKRGILRRRTGINVST